MCNSPSGPSVVVEPTTIHPVAERRTFIERSSFGAPWAIAIVLAVVAVIGIVAYESSFAGTRQPANVVENSTIKIVHDVGGQSQAAAPPAPNIVVNPAPSSPSINVNPPASHPTVNVNTPPPVRQTQTPREREASVVSRQTRTTETRALVAITTAARASDRILARPLCGIQPMVAVTADPFESGRYVFGC
jgi:hypothetical protein